MRAPLSLCLILAAAACGDDAMMTGDDVVDDTVPDTSFAATPGGDLDHADDSVFELACDGDAPCMFECSLDDAAFTACDELVTLAYLAVGEHTLAARAIDADGDVDETPATHTWSLAFGWRALAGARRSTCAIAGDGALYCWGIPEAFASKTPPVVAAPTRVGTDVGWEAIVAGDHAYCARRAGATSCWGDADEGVLGDPALGQGRIAEPTLVAHAFAQLSLGDNHGCGIDDAGALFCWGDGYGFALGTGDEDPQLSPVQIGTATWAQVSAGSNATCAIDTGGALWCWGENGSGNGGQDPVTEALEVPTRLGARTDWATVRTSGGHACALDDAAGLWCWGYNGDGRLGDGTTTSTFTPVQVPGTWRDVVVAYDGTCGVATDGVVSCWGSNTRAQLGSAAPVAQSASPIAIDSDEAFTLVTGVGDLHCALGDRDVVCWGDNQHTGGGMGAGVTGGEPQVIALDGGWAQLAVNHGGGCGVRANGTLACWGLGFHVGQDVALAVAPVDVSADTDWYQVALDASGDLSLGHACGVREGGLACWGTNAQGQIGDGTTTLRTRPVTIPPVTSAWNLVATGSGTTCAITTDGRLYCWGNGVTTPTAITTPAATGWASISLFDRRYTALRTDGTLWAWGTNPNGLTQATPVQIGTDTDWAEAVSSAVSTTCARKTSGALYCSDLTFAPVWARPLTQVGEATDHGAVIPFEGGVCALRAGELHCYWPAGGASWTDNFPTLDVNGSIPNPSGTWAQISVGYDLRCGVRADGTRACAGFRFAGSLGDGFDERVPTATLTP